MARVFSRRSVVGIAAALCVAALTPPTAAAAGATSAALPATAANAMLGNPVFIPAGVGLVDPNNGIWHLRNDLGDPAVFFFGNPGDFPFVGDWDCNGTDTPGLYRQSDGFVYLRNSNTVGVADIEFFFGDPGDVPIAGDFDNDGCDTVSIYRPSNQRFYIINELGEDGGGLGFAEFEYTFGNPGDKPFVGDFDGDGTETIGLHRESTGLVYFRNSHSAGFADNQFIFGDPGDRLIAGDWNANGIDSPAVFRPGNRTVYQRYTNNAGFADNAYTWGDAAWRPVAGYFGPLTSGVTVNLTNTPPAGVTFAVESLYLELPRAPMLPDGLRQNLVFLSSAPKTLTLNGVYTGAEAFGGHVAVVTIGSDEILLVSDDGMEYRVVGTKMTSYSKPRWFGGSPRFFAVIGGDNAGSPNPLDPDPLLSYADSVHLVSLVPAPVSNPATAAGAIVGIPRDTVVHVPYDHGGTVAYCTGQCDQINHTMQDKGSGLPNGPATTVTALELETGLDLEGYFHTGFGTAFGGPPGFGDLVDAYIAASTAFDFLVPYDVPGAPEGQTTVDGGDALAFARERSSRPRGDQDRTLAQGLLIKAAIAEVQPLTLQSTPGLLAIMDGFVTTDLDLDQILTFAATLFALDPGPMPTLTPANLASLGSGAYDLNPGSIPNIVLSGCNHWPSSNPTDADRAATSTFPVGGSFAYWLTPNNRVTIGDLADGILTLDVVECLNF